VGAMLSYVEIHQANKLPVTGDSMRKEKKSAPVDARS